MEGTSLINGGMKVRVLGCSGGVSRHHQGVSFVLEDRLALDAGSIASGLTLDEQDEIGSVLVTHSHLDHVGDLGALADTRLQRGGEPLAIAATATTLEALRAHYFNDVLWPDFSTLPDHANPIVRYVEIHHEVPLVLEEFTALPVAVDHSVPSCGFLMGRSGACDDYTLAYSGDTGPTERFWQVVGYHPGIRALITEVSFPDRMHELATISGHLTTSAFARELEKLEPSDERRVFVYGMKPAFVEEITSELEELGLEVELLTADTVLEL